jgi:hypothetical protein
MASYVLLSIDTASPNIEIYAPSYTTTDIINEIVVQADESLSLDYYELYAIDNNGVRYNYDFLLDDDKFIGHVKFYDMPIGSIITLYAKVMDKVGNVSNLVSKAIHIAGSITLLTLEINDRELVNVEIDDKSRSVETSDKAMNIESSDRSEQIGSK